jgi:hypothetical protein
MNLNLDEIEVNGVVYCKKGIENKQAEKTDGMEFVIVRTYSAGVFAGWLKERNGKEGTIINARRLFYWSGACSLSQMAVDGTSRPKECKFSVVVPKTELTEIIEILRVSEKAKKSIDGVEIWKI